MIENRRVKAFWKLRAFTKFLRPIKPILITISAAISKYGHIWFTDYNGKRITD